MLTFTKQCKLEVDVNLSDYAEERRLHCVDVLKLYIVESRDYEIKALLTSLEKCPVESYQGRVLSVHI